ncbi:MAG: tetratricopeptide repeat protein [Candidatus Yanofskybacteria bacterium]|nr:tetratricopeptide repeat protein [Candidatus Yanofskybacteria bacterium]
MSKDLFAWIKNNQTIAVLILSIVLSFAVFGNGIFNDFTFDDVAVVQNRGDLKDPSNFFNLFVSPYHLLAKLGLFRPFTMASYAVNHYINDAILTDSATSFQQAAGFRVANIIIHALNSFLVFWLIRCLFKNRFLSYATFLLFLVHPIHTEAVTSIVGRAELLAFFWSLVAIYFFIKKDTFLSSVSFLFALLSKEVALMALPILFYVDWGVMKNRFFQTINRTFIFTPVVLVYAALRYKALGAYFFGDVTMTIVGNHLKFLPLKERVLTAFKVLYMYLERLVWPVHLSADYSYSTISPVSRFVDLTFLVGAVFFIFLLGFLVFRKTHGTAVAFGALAFLSPYIMISNLIKPVGTIMGERLMYFSSFGFILLFSYVLLKVSEKISKKIIYVFLALLIIFFSARTIIRNGDWYDARTLFTATLKESPNSLIARMAMAAVHVKDDEWDEAKEQLNIALDIYEDNSRVQNLWGIIADHEGDQKLAEERYLRSLELNPDAINAQINLAELYAKQGRLEEAGVMFKKVIEFYPVIEYVVRYAYTQIALNNPDEAISAVGYYLGDDLNHPDISALAGTAYFVKGDYKMALFFLKKAVEFGNTVPEIKEMIQISEGNL